ncbi:MAG TPA: HAMP domain-containing sensor histidine kinase [Microbacterium sp.]|uniref:sensor histidine kinase n=1 Tax=Microbacterium sp. TaxID=51671 RepID=UPI002B490D4C|nr:HAMP domain-containing sensor histidine kinase [Microbacterium sp.]HKT56983.1 HAMP domain-containing sensor histidine kinase [Microbacterium sp.]
MRSSGTRPRSADASAIARASRIVTAQITAVAAVIVALVVIVSVTYVIHQSQPRERLEKPPPGETRIYADAQTVWVALVVVGAGAIIVAALLSWLIARRAVRPLGEALRMQRTFVADASHELRTPLTVIGARVEVLKQELDAGEDPTENLDELRSDVNALGDVITDLLLASSPREDTAEPYAVAEVIEPTADDLRLLGRARGVRLNVTADAGVTTRVPTATLRRSVVALVDNAIVHSPDGSTVDITVRRASRGMFALIVTDHGPGLIGIDKFRIFERFAHSDTGAVRTGFGLGLALVRDLADRHGGRIEVTDTSSAGTTFTLTLPSA